MSRLPFRVRSKHGKSARRLLSGSPLPRLTSRRPSRHAQNILSMKVEKPPLALQEQSDVHSGFAVNAHTLK